MLTPGPQVLDQHRKNPGVATEPSQDRNSFRAATNMDTWTLLSPNPRGDLPTAKMVNPGWKLHRITDTAKNRIVAAGNS